MRMYFVLLLIPFLVANSHVAEAQRNAANPEAMFDLLDVDKDGMLSRDEFLKHQPGMMRGPGAGKKSGQGRQSGGAGQGRGMGQGGGVPPMFKNVDSNDDGAVTFAEMTAFREGVFYAMDEDDSGQLTIDEYMAVRMGPGADPSVRGKRSDQAQSRKRDRFVPMDTDKNSLVSREEFMAFGKSAFDKADQDRNGRLSPMEFRGHSRL